MFATPDDSAASNTDDTLNTDDTTGDSGMSDFEKDEPKALKRFFDHPSATQTAMGNTNNLHDIYSQSRNDAADGDLGKDKIDPAGHSAFFSPSPGNSIIGQLFQSPSAQDAVHDAGGAVGGNGLFSDEFASPAQEDDRQLHADEEKRRDAMNQVPGFLPAASKSAGDYNSVSGIAAAPASGSPFGGLNTIDNGAASAALSAPSQQEVSGSSARLPARPRASSPPPPPA